MRHQHVVRGIGLVAGLLSVVLFTASDAPGGGIPNSQQYVVIGWNDLGMHCMNGDFSGLCILPPYNNLYVQIIQRGDSPQLVNSGMEATYRFPLNTTSANKVNFWQYEDQLFGVSLPSNVGLTGNGLTGSLEWSGDAYKAEGVPLTPFEDAAPSVEQPYQLAEVKITHAGQSEVLDTTTFCAPVSVEMHCDKCHHEDGESTWDTILKKHDDEEDTNLRNSKPVLCANCHATNALGKPGNPELPSLSLALHGKHAEEVSNISCYDCHPGQRTQCLRGAMYLAGKYCTDCHGSISHVASTIKQGRRPWLDEPTCASCHPAYPENAGKLYRQSTGHGGLYCAACHNSPHSELPTVELRDAIQAVRLQGQSTYLRNCTVCHTKTPTGPGPHGISAPRNATPADEWTMMN